MREKKEKNKVSNYEPHHYEKANFHVFFLCAVVFSIAYQSFQVPTLPFWNALAFALFIQIVPVLAVYADFKAMCKRRQSFEQYFPESFWSEEGVTS
jgi:hypothetical protein